MTFLHITDFRFKKGIKIAPTRQTVGEKRLDTINLRILHGSNIIWDQRSLSRYICTNRAWFGAFNIRMADLKSVYCLSTSARRAMLGPCILGFYLILVTNKARLGYSEGHGPLTTWNRSRAFWVCIQPKPHLVEDSPRGSDLFPQCSNHCQTHRLANRFCNLLQYRWEAFT